MSGCQHKNGKINKEGKRKQTCKVKPTALYPLIMQRPDANYSKCILGTSSAIYVLKLCYKNFPLLIINDIKKEHRQPVQTKPVLSTLFAQASCPPHIYQLNESQLEWSKKKCLICYAWKPTHVRLWMLLLQGIVGGFISLCKGLSSEY